MVDLQTLDLLVDRCHCRQERRNRDDSTQVRGHATAEFQGGHQLLQVPAGARGSIGTWKVASSRAGQYDLVAWVSDQPPYVIRLNIILPDKRLYDWTMI